MAEKEGLLRELLEKIVKIADNSREETEQHECPFGTNLVKGLETDITPEFYGNPDILKGFIMGAAWLEQVVCYDRMFIMTAARYGFRGALNHATEHAWRLLAERVRDLELAKGVPLNVPAEGKEPGCAG